jgi:hypothetical protein
VNNNPFEQAVQLTHAIYTFAALHLIAEKKNGAWVNKYTSVTYGREADLRSVPPAPGAKCEEGGGVTFLCLRQRLTRDEAEKFVSQANQGSAGIGIYTVAYDVEPAIVGFRAENVSGDLAEGSLWHSSGWSREYIGKMKEIAGHTLTLLSAWRINESLDFLRKAIWVPIPLREHPEKLGDLDEFWPAPITFDVGRVDGVCAIRIAHDILMPEDDDLTISGALIQNDLIWGHVCFAGRGPHKLPIDPDAIDLTLCVRGVPLDAKAHRFLLRIAVGIAVDAGVPDTYTVPEAGGRPEMTFPVGSTEMKQQLIGKPPKPSVRPAAWTIGRLFRNRTVLPDAERFYDPVAIADSVQRAFDDLREFGRGEHRPRVLVADPYALDERALYAIGAIAARFGSVASIDIATGFKTGDMDAPPSAGGVFNELWKACKSWLSFGRVSLVTRRQEAERLAFSAAESVSKQLKIRFRFYRAEGLHDRFLVIGERLWHVGPSFNKIGEQISAIVEITDERVKAQVLESLARFTAVLSVQETNP